MFQEPISTSLDFSIQTFHEMIPHTFYRVASPWMSCNSTNSTNSEPLHRRSCAAEQPQRPAQTGKLFHSKSSFIPCSGKNVSVSISCAVLQFLWIISHWNYIPAFSRCLSFHIIQLRVTAFFFFFCIFSSFQHTFAQFYFRFRFLNLLSEYRLFLGF